MADNIVIQSGINDPLESAILIDELSSGDETIADLRLKSQNNFKKYTDLCRINLSKPHYQVEKGKIIRIKTPFLNDLETKPSKKIIRNNELIHSGGTIRNVKLHTKLKTPKKPDALDRLMAQIDAQLIAQGLPVPKGSPIGNETVLNLSFSNKTESLKKIDAKSDSSKYISNSMTANMMDLEDKTINDSNSSERIVDLCKSENVSSSEPKSTDETTDENFTISVSNNSNDDFYWPEDIYHHDECSRDTIKDLGAPNEIKNNFNNYSKYEIMESNDGSFVQYKVYNKFEDYSSEKNTDEYLVTSALQIELCKKIQSNGKHKIKQRNMWKNVKIFQSYESFLKSYERFLKLNNKCKKKIYEYDGIKLNPIIFNNVNSTSSGKFFKISEDSIEQEIIDNDSKRSDIQCSSNEQNQFNNIEAKKKHQNEISKGIFYYSFKYEKINKNNERMTRNYQVLDPHSCELCGKTFSNKRILKKHHKIVHFAQHTVKNERLKEKKQRSCETSFEPFKHLEDFTDQDRRHYQRNSTCTKSDFADSTISKGQSAGDPETIDEKIFKCNKCFEVFLSCKCMKLHFKNYHPKTKKTYPFKCKLCKTGFKKMTDLLRHIYSVHEVKILTKNTFISNKDNLDLFNLEIGNEQKLLQSVNCKLVVANSTSILTKDCTVAIREKKILESQNKSVINRGRLERDPFRYQLNKITVTVNGGENLDLYKCDRCPKVFAIQKSLADHKRRVHLKSNLNNPDYSFICKPCKKGYRRSNDLMRHARLYHKVIIRNNRCIPNSIPKELKISNVCLDPNTTKKTILNSKESFKSIDPKLSITESFKDQQLCIIKNAWGCDFCSKSYDTQKKWRDHQRRVHISRPVKLKVISSETMPCRNLQDLFDEKLIATNEYGKYICKYCTESFDCFETFKNHLNSKHKESIINADSAYPFSCQKCKKVFTKSSEVIKHAKDVHKIILKIPHSDSGRQEYFCDSCPKQFRFKQSLRRHIESTHSKTIDPSEYIKCNDGCSKSFQSQAHLERHLRLYSHFRCVTCNIHFSNQIMLDKHQVYHTKERQYICPVCTKSYMQKHHLVQHELIHGDKKHKCPHCPISCFTGSQLNSHLRIHSGDRPFKCHFCPGTFKRAQALRHHERLHTGDKSTYCCSSCDRSFRSSNGLSRHERSHRIGIITSRISQVT